MPFLYPTKLFKVAILGRTVQYLFDILDIMQMKWQHMLCKTFISASSDADSEFSWSVHVSVWLDTIFEDILLLTDCEKSLSSFFSCYFSKTSDPFQHACARSEMCTVYIYKYYVQGRTKVSLFFLNNFALQAIWSVHKLFSYENVVVMPLF